MIHEAPEKVPSISPNRDCLSICDALRHIGVETIGSASGMPFDFRVIVCAIICSDFDRPLAGQSDKELPPATEQTGGLGMRFYRQSGAVVTPTDARSIGFMHTIHRFSESRMMGQPPG